MATEQGISNLFENLGLTIINLNTSIKTHGVFAVVSVFLESHRSSKNGLSLLKNMESWLRLSQKLRLILHY